MYDRRGFKGQTVHREGSLGTRLRQNGGSDTVYTISCFWLYITLVIKYNCCPILLKILIWGQKELTALLPRPVAMGTLSFVSENMMKHASSSWKLFSLFGIFSLPVVIGNMHALNEYYYVKGDPGDKVCFPKHIIKTSHGHINVSRASMKNLYGGYSTRRHKSLFI